MVTSIASNSNRKCIQLVAESYNVSTDLPVPCAYRWWCAMHSPIHTTVIFEFDFSLVTSYVWFMNTYIYIYLLFLFLLHYRHRRCDYYFFFVISLYRIFIEIICRARSIHSAANNRMERPNQQQPKKKPNCSCDLKYSDSVCIRR